MTMKYISLIIVLVVVLVTPQAEAQLLPPTPPIGLITVLNVTGVIGCSLNGSINTAPPFQNALVNLTCGSTVVASNTTNMSGTFVITLSNLAPSIVSALLSGGCKVVVDTPLATCNASLPLTGILQAPLQIVGNTVNGTVNLITVIVNGLFTFLGTILV
ncbi:hypothetical protein R6Q59_016086 [Mikania micrantha]|uniref:Phylloplanin n=1 Tax=Mikania micrantha TaxID=192012 RepID=A0A5N6PK48_9ASTR|nr:hypothetical protein E3N88_09002 [Mikania micrantha]